MQLSAIFASYLRVAKLRPSLLNRILPTSDKFSITSPWIRVEPSYTPFLHLFITSAVTRPSLPISSPIVILPLFLLPITLFSDRTTSKLSLRLLCSQCRQTLLSSATVSPFPLCRRYSITPSLSWIQP